MNRHLTVYGAIGLVIITFGCTIVASSASANKSAPIQVATVCNASEHEHCLAPVIRLRQQTNLSYPVNSAELQAACGIMKHADQCISRILRQCTEVPTYEMFTEMLRGTQLTFALICVKGKVQEDYLRYSECYKLVTLAKCQANQTISPVAQAQYAHEEANRTSEVELRRYCCDYKQTIECQTKWIKRICSRGALQFFEHYTDQISRSLISDHCDGFIGRYKCHRKTALVEVEDVHRGYRKEKWSTMRTTPDGVRRQEDRMNQLGQLMPKNNGVRGCQVLLSLVMVAATVQLGLLLNGE